MSRPILAQELLRSGMTPAELYERHAVKCKPHSGKVSLIYDQIEAKPSDPVANQCRGMVLREGTWELLAYPFDRFFNYGQPEAEGLDLSTAAFEEKLDGTLVIAYWDNDESKWHAATRGMCEAHGNVLDGFTTRDLIEKACVEMGRGSFRDFMDLAHRGNTFCFELTAPENQIVCEYRERKLTLLGARNMTTLEEVSTRLHAESNGWLLPRTWQLNDLDHIVEVIRDWDPAEFEGIIAKDAKFHRVKVKAPKYLAVHHAIDSLGASWRSCIAAVQSGASDDIGRYVPAFVQERIELCRARIADLVRETEADLANLTDAPTMKDFALVATKRRFPPALFSVKRGQFATVSDFVAQYEPAKLAELCGLTPTHPHPGKGGSC